MSIIMLNSKPDLSLLIPTNLRENITVDGITGTLKEQENLIAGDTSKVNAPTVRNAMTPWTKIKEIKMNYKGRVRVYFELQTSNAGYSSQGRIYKNGVAVGTTRNTTVQDFTSYTEDFNVVVGDLIQLWGYFLYAESIISSLFSVSFHNFWLNSFIL
jgi:hypothetical protein